MSKGNPLVPEDSWVRKIPLHPADGQFDSEMLDDRISEA